jgi:uncharacterized protein involved in response to NO
MNTLLLSAYFWLSRAQAQVFNGTGLAGGTVEAGRIEGPSHAPLRGIILEILAKALNFLALIAVVMIIIAGFTYVLSGGNDTAKDRAKKIIIYVAIGLIIVLLSRAGVAFMLIDLANEVQ